MVFDLSTAEFFRLVKYRFFPIYANQKLIGEQSKAVFLYWAETPFVASYFTELGKQKISTFGWCLPCVPVGRRDSIAARAVDSIASRRGFYCGARGGGDGRLEGK